MEATRVSSAPVNEAKASNTAKSDDEAMAMQEGGPQMEGPVNSSILGTIVDFAELDQPVAETSPCSKHPCRALVHVQNVLRFGSNYHGQFNPGDTIPITFAFTMAPTKDLFPEFNQHLPGLQPGDSFQAELLERGGVENSYTVQMYDLTDKK